MLIKTITKILFLTEKQIFFKTVNIYDSNLKKVKEIDFSSKSLSN